VDILSNYTNVPDTFTPSFIRKLNQKMQCLGGCVFDIFQNYDTIKSQIRSTYNIANDTLDYKLAQHTPALSAEITLKKASQIPFPDTSALSPDLIKSRAVKIGIFSLKQKEFVANTTVVYPTPLSLKNRNTWDFSADSYLNKVQFTIGFGMKDEDISALYVVFEFTYSILQGKELVDMSAGFCVVNSKQLNENNTIKLEIMNGSPYQNIDKMSAQYLAFHKKNKRFLTIGFRTFAKYSKGRKIQVAYMPSLYLIPGRSIYYASIVRQYIAERLLETNFDVSKLMPDPIYSVCVKAFNSPDTMELLLPFIKTELMDIRTTESRLASMSLLDAVKEISYCLNCAICCSDYQYDEATPYLDTHSSCQFDKRRSIMNACFALITRKPIKYDSNVDQ